MVEDGVIVCKILGSCPIEGEGAKEYAEELAKNLDRLFERADPARLRAAGHPEDLKTRMSTAKRSQRGGNERGRIPGPIPAVLAIGVLIACSTSPAYWQSKNLQPLNIGWQQFFRVQWDASEFQGQPIVEGYITNVWGFRARSLQLLVSGYDGTGALVGQLVGWGPFSIAPGGRVYFNLSVPAAPTYEVAIFSWSWVLDDDDWREFFFR